jgi:hypothetical protein
LTWNLSDLLPLSLLRKLTISSSHPLPTPGNPPNT